MIAVYQHRQVLTFSLFDLQPFLEIQRDRDIKLTLRRERRENTWGKPWRSCQEKSISRKLDGSYKTGLDHRPCLPLSPPSFPDSRE